MSQVVWEPEQPERAALSTESQTGRPLGDGTASTPSADAAPTSRRAARELRQQQEAAEAAARELRQQQEAAQAAASQLRPRRTTARKPGSRKGPSQRRASRATTRPTVVPSLAHRRVPVRAMLTKLMSFSAMVGVAGILVATSIPANAFIPAVPEEAAQAEQEVAPANIGVQSLDVQDAEAAAKTQERDSYTVLSLTEQLRGKYDTAAFRFTNNPYGTIQWPFATGVPISSGFGDRYACSYCSTNHLGVDFVPGEGSPIQAIADGVVREVNPGGGAYGVNIIIDHEINGEKVTSLYAHMQWGSPVVAAGQAVTVGEYLGDVGSTGASTGPHLHLEIHVDETPVDPFVWLKANAN